MTMTIRSAVPEDAPTFARWNAAMAWETEGKRLDVAALERGARGVFARPERGFYLVAERDGAEVGGLLITFEWSDWRDGEYWWIQSVYVEPAARGAGVFRALYAEAVRLAREAKAVGVRLYVERENTAAQATYRALGMEESDYLMFETPMQRT